MRFEREPDDTSRGARPSRNAKPMQPPTQAIAACPNCLQSEPRRQPEATGNVRGYPPNRSSRKAVQIARNSRRRRSAPVEQELNSRNRTTQYVGRHASGLSHEKARNRPTAGIIFLLHFGQPPLEQPNVSAEEGKRMLLEGRLELTECAEIPPSAHRSGQGLNPRMILSPRAMSPSFHARWRWPPSTCV